MNINTLLSLSPIIAILVGLVGWPIVHWLNSSRDAKNKKREIRINFLLAAYRSIDNGIRSIPYICENIKYFDSESFEKAISDVQLLGTESQIEKAKQLCLDMNRGNPYDPEPLLKDLRNELRKELGLKQSDIEFFFSFAKQ